MIYRIREDESEFKDIIRRKIREDLLDNIERGRVRILGPDRQGVISVPIDEIEIPQLKFGEIISPAESDPDDVHGQADNQSDDIGIGEGKGNVGTDLGPVPLDDESGDGEGRRRAGRGRGGDGIWVVVPKEILWDVFMEDLELPRIKPKGDRSVKVEEEKYNDIYHVGSESTLYKPRTIREAIKRLSSEGEFDPNKFNIIQSDKRYLTPKVEIKPKSNAVIYYMMDVSGSMTEDDRGVVRFFCELFELWIKRHYDNLETVYIIHNGEADEVGREAFYTSGRAGGTLISSAHELMLKSIYEKFPPETWNIYPLYFSDGFNWIEDDSKCVKLLREKILPIVNQYTYGEVQTGRFWRLNADSEKKIEKHFSPGGNFGAVIDGAFHDNELVVSVNLHDKKDVLEAIKIAFASGH